MERGRKKSDLIPERRMEKKKGERAMAFKRSYRRERREPGLVPFLTELGEGSLQLGSVWLCLHLSSMAVVPASRQSIYRVCRDHFPT